MSTLKELHEQVGRLPFRVGGIGTIISIEYKLSNGQYAGVYDTGGSDTFVPNNDRWQLVPEKKKALAYVGQLGSIYFVISGSDEERNLRLDGCKPAPEFDIESRE